MEWQPTPLFLPGESHGQRSTVGYSPWGRKDSDTIEWLSTVVGVVGIREVDEGSQKVQTCSYKINKY